MRLHSLAVVMALLFPALALAQVGPKAAVAIDHDNWITWADYPAEAKAARATGTVQFQIGITPDGRPEKCVILRSSGFKALDDTTCETILKRARFIPAIDGHGSPAEGGYRDRVIWKLPKEASR